MYVCMYVFVPVLCCVADFFPCRFLYVTDVFQDALCDPGSSSYHLLVDIQRNACLASIPCVTHALPFSWKSIDNVLSRVSMQCLHHRAPLLVLPILSVQCRYVYCV